MAYQFDASVNVTGIGLRGGGIVMVLLTADDMTQQILRGLLQSFDFRLMSMPVDQFNATARQLGQPEELMDKYATALVKTERGSSTYKDILDSLLSAGLIGERSYRSSCAAFDGM